MKKRTAVFTILSIVSILMFERCAKNEMPRTVTNSIGAQFILIESGKFIMGSPDSIGLENEHPMHEVVINKAFYMGKHPVTVREFKSFVEESGYITSGEQSEGSFIYEGANKWQRKADASWRNPYFSQTENHPVVCVSWYDAKAFANWLSKKEGKTYRLPTEAEFEYALRAGRSTTYMFGDDFSEYVKYGWPQEKTENGYPTHPVGGKLPNAFGLYDMIGNAWQWCEDWFAEDYYNNSPVIDPVGPESGEYKTNRGAMGKSSEIIRSAFRDALTPEEDYSNQTFRLVLEVELK